MKPRGDRIVEPDAVDAVAVPVSRNGNPSRAGGAVLERDVVGAGDVGIPQVEGRGRGVIETDGVDAVAVPISGYGAYSGTRRAVGECVGREAEVRVSLSEVVVGGIHGSFGDSA